MPVLKIEKYLRGIAYQIWERQRRGAGQVKYYYSRNAAGKVLVTAQVLAGGTRSVSLDRLGRTTTSFSVTGDYSFNPDSILADRQNCTGL